MNKLISNNWTKAITINLIILIAVFYISDLAYETNDDFAISARIVSGFPYIGFINYFFCLALIPVQSLLPNVNIFVVSQILFSFAGFVFMLKLMLDSCKNRGIMVLCTFAVALFSFDHYAVVQFTKTAALLLVVGMLIIVDSMINRRRVFYYVCSIIFLFLGVSFRPDSLICAIGFAGIYLVFWVVTNRKKLIIEKYLEPKRIALYIILLAFIGSSWGYYQLSEYINQNGDAKEYYEYGELRTAIVDYPVFDYYEENREQYEEIGISENDLYLIDKWYLDYDGAASKENLTAILKVDGNSQREPYTWAMSARDLVTDIIRNIKDLSFTGIHLILLILLAMCMFVILKPKHWLYIISLGVFAICIYIAVYYMQRPVYRALYVADVGTATWLLYYLCNNIDYCEQKKYKNTAILVLAVLTLFLCFPVNVECTLKYKQMQSKVMSHELENYFNSHDDEFFVLSASDKKYPKTFRTPLKAPDESDDRNTIGAGSWGTMSSYLFDKMKKYSISNPVRDLINSDNAYYVGNSNIERLTEYYNKWYGDEFERIEMVNTDSVDGMNVWRVISGETE